MSAVQIASWSRRSTNSSKRHTRRVRPRGFRRGGPSRDALDALFAFLRVEVATLADVEAAIFGRSPDMVSPSEQTSRNLVADAHDIPDAVIPLLIERVEAVVGDLRHAGRVSRTDPSRKFLRDIADGLKRTLRSWLPRTGCAVEDIAIALFVGKRSSRTSAERQVSAGWSVESGG